jgi:NHL repeat
MKGEYRKYLSSIAGLLALVVIGASGWSPVADAQQAPQFVVDPSWPKPLPSTTINGVAHPWVQGEIAGNCVDINNNVYTFNRGWEVGQSGLTGTTGTPGSESGQIVGQDAIASAIPSPPVVVFDTEGNTVAAWGNPSLYPSSSPYYGYASYMPEGAHGCFVDYQGNIWLGGNGDGIVQKYNPALAASQGANATFVYQLGTKGLCDPGTSSTLFSQCGAATGNSSHTLLNEPADIAVDPNPDPITHTPGTVYIADGYGNHRVVVYTTSDGGKTYQYNRQWGQACSTTGEACPPGTFGASGGGHPHCVVLGNDGLIYVCDRPDNRIEVFQKSCGAASTASDPQPMCTPVEIINVGLDASLSSPNCTGVSKCVGSNAFDGAAPAARAAIALAGTRGDDIDFWPNVDPLASRSPTSQSVMVNVDLGNDNTWLWDKAAATVFGALGVCGILPCPGHNAGHFAFGHTTAVDSLGNIYVAETITGRRIQKFVPVNNFYPH